MLLSNGNVEGCRLQTYLLTRWECAALVSPDDLTTCWICVAALVFLPCLTCICATTSEIILHWVTFPGFPDKIVFVIGLG